jgi:hypothetical protein
MPVSVAPTESQVYKALGDFLSAIVISGTEILQAQENRLPEPSAANFITMNAIRQVRLGTNFVAQSSDPNHQTANITQETVAVIQIDIHGPTSGATALAGDNANIVSTLLRDAYAVDFFDANSPGITPLYSEDPRQIPFLNDQQQIEDRWMIDVHLQVNPNVIVTQQSALALVTSVVDVDEAYPAT